MPVLELPATAYRTRFFLGAISSIQWPFSFTFILLKLIGDSSLLLRIALYAASLPIWIGITEWYNEWRNDRLAREHGAQTIPSVKGKWPGNVDIMLRLGKDLRTGYVMQVFTDLLDEHHCDTLNVRILWRSMIISRDDLVIKSVHSTKFLAFERGFEGREWMGTFLGRGIFVSDGEEWKQNRAMIRPFFSKERISDVNIVDTHADKAISILTEAAQSNTVVDLQDIYARFTLDAGADFLLGMKTKSLSAPRPVAFTARLGAKGAATDGDFGSFAYAFDHIQVVIALRTRVGKVWPLYELFGDRTLPDAKVITDWVKPRVEEALQEKAKRRQDGLSQGKSDRTLLDTLIEQTEDEAAVRYGLLNVLMASRDTTAALLSFTTYLLCLHPQAMQRLRQEVLESCGQTGQPSRESLQKLPYMTAVLNESLRLFPPAPRGTRQAIKDTYVTSAEHGTFIHIPKGSRLNWNTVALHRRPDFWGEDAEDFVPQRWLDPEIAKRIAERPSMYIPFLQGPRVCPGQDFAKLQVAYLLSRILQKFSQIELVPEALPKDAIPPEHWKQRKGRQSTEQCWPSTAFTLFMKGGMWVRVHE